VARRLCEALRGADSLLVRFRPVAAGSNGNAGPGKNTSKLDAETEELHRARPLARAAARERCTSTRHTVCAAQRLTAARATPRADDKVSSELKTNIMKARLEKKMTQAQLAQASATRALATAPLRRTLRSLCADAPP